VHVHVPESRDHVAFAAAARRRGPNIGDPVAADQDVAMRQELRGYDIDHRDIMDNRRRSFGRALPPMNTTWSSEQKNRNQQAQRKPDHETSW
jgi:hypothetical protein